MSRFKFAADYSWFDVQEARKILSEVWFDDGTTAIVFVLYKLDLVDWVVD